MPATTSAQSKIQELQEQIELLKDTAIKELRERRVAVAQELHIVDAELARLTGKAAEQTRTRGRRASGGQKSLTIEELRSLLAAAPDKTLSLRKEGIDVKGVKALAQENPGVLKMGGKGAWPSVTLVK